MVAKVNHVPCLEEPLDQSMIQPNNDANLKQLEKWKTCSGDNKLYTPGYPYGSMYTGVSCNN